MTSPLGVACSLPLAIVKVFVRLEFDEFPGTTVSRPRPWFFAQAQQAPSCASKTINYTIRLTRESLTAATPRGCRSHYHPDPGLPSRGRRCCRPDGELLSNWVAAFAGPAAVSLPLPRRTVCNSAVAATA